MSEDRRQFLLDQLGGCFRTLRGWIAIAGSNITGSNSDVVN